jgi:hypothetical protein
MQSQYESQYYQIGEKQEFLNAGLSTVLAGPQKSIMPSQNHLSIMKTIATPNHKQSKMQSSVITNQ